MTDKQIDRLLSRIEWDHQDELNMVNQFDMDYFSTDYLEEIYTRWYERCERLRAFYKSTLQLVLVACSCMLFGIVGLIGNIVFLTPFFYVAFILMLAYAASMTYLSRHFGSIRTNEDIGDKIRAELRRRYDAMYI